MTQISSQSDIWAESYDQNTRGCSDGLTERLDGQLQPPFQNSTESFHNKAASGRSTMSLFSASVKETRNILEHWVVSGRVATASGHLIEPSQIVSSEIHLCVELEVAWPSVRTM
jgi:hypothetical protein